MSSILTLANLRILLGSVDSTMLSDDEGEFALDMALSEINKRYGYAAADKTSLTTVTDQQEYDVPSGVNVRKITDIIWSKSNVSTILGDISLDTVMVETTINEGWGGVMQTLLDDVKNAWRMARAKGMWHIVNQKIWLDPAPTEDGTAILILYDADYATADAVPAIYDQRFWWIAMSWALEIMAAKDAGVLEVTDGSQTLRMDGGSALRKYAAQLRQRYSRAIG